jgi:hypothetical protein
MSGTPQVAWVMRQIRPMCISACISTMHISVGALDFAQFEFVLARPISQTGFGIYRWGNELIADGNMRLLRKILMKEVPRLQFHPV